MAEIGETKDVLGSAVTQDENLDSPKDSAPQLEPDSAQTQEDSQGHIGDGEKDVTAGIVAESQVENADGGTNNGARDDADGKGPPALPTPIATFNLKWK